MAKKRDYFIEVPDDGLLTNPIGPWAEDKYGYVGMYAELFATGMKNRWPRRDPACDALRLALAPDSRAANTPLPASKSPYRRVPRIITFTPTSPQERTPMTPRTPALVAALAALAIGTAHGQTCTRTPLPLERENRHVVRPPDTNRR